MRSFMPLAITSALVLGSAAASCTLIADVDRTKIGRGGEAGAAASGGASTGGSSSGGAANTGGAATGGSATGGSATGGSAGEQNAEGGMGGSAGSN